MNEHEKLETVVEAAAEIAAAVSDSPKPSAIQAAVDTGVASGVAEGVATAAKMLQTEEEHKQWQAEMMEKATQALSVAQSTQSTLQDISARLEAALNLVAANQNPTQPVVAMLPTQENPTSVLEVPVEAPVEVATEGLPAPELPPLVAGPASVGPPRKRKMQWL